MGVTKESKTSGLLLGWKVNGGGHPFFHETDINGRLEKIYGYGKTGHPVLGVEKDGKWQFESDGRLQTSWKWPIRSPKVPSPTGVKEVQPKHLETHALILAQSGSGKSFFLGRLIEEILLKTRARCLVLDPNGDFRLAHNIRDPLYWKKARYEPTKIKGSKEAGRNWLRTERTREEFKNSWTKITMQAFPDSNDTQAPEIRLSWELVNVALVAPPGQPVFESQLRYAAKIVGLLIPLAGLWDRVSDGPNRHTVLELAKRLVACNLGDDASFRESWEKIDRQVVQKAKREGVTPNWDERSRIDEAAAAWRFSSPDALRLFISTLEEGETRVLDFLPRSVGSIVPSAIRLGVLDLPAIDEGRGQESLRMLAVQCFMKAVWEDAYEIWQRAVADRDEVHDRVPTFIVVDEAHNLIPSSQSVTQASAVVRESFRRIAAEGRKYGLFLILVSQRPDKLDPLVASECGNRALMRLSGPGELENSMKLMGIPTLHHVTQERLLNLEKGRFFLYGDWAGDEAKERGEPEGDACREAREAQSFAYAAARRTLEGGANIPDSWRKVAQKSETGVTG